MSTSVNVGFGVNVWWTCPEIIRNASDVHEVIKKHGFKASDIPIPARRTEVSRAVYSFQNRLGKTNRRVTEKANDNINFVTYGILDREQEEVDTVGFTQHTTIRLDKSTDEVKVEGNLVSEVMAAIQVYSGKITDDDIRYFLRRVVRFCFGIAKRPTGGIYFVPDQFANIIRSAQAALDELGTGARLYVEGVVNGVQERQNVWESVEDEMASRIEETLSAVERIEQRTSAVKDQEEKLKGMKGMMKVYVDLLGEEAKYQSITEKLEAAIKTVSSKMSVMQQSSSVIKKSEKLIGFDDLDSAKKAAMPPPPQDPANPQKTRKKRENKAGEFKNNWVKYAYDVLKESGVPMKIQDITDKAIEKGMSMEAKNHVSSMYTGIWTSIKSGDGLFKKDGRGTFSLA